MIKVIIQESFETLDEYTRMELVNMASIKRFDNRDASSVKYLNIDIDSLLGNGLQYLDVKLQVTKYICTVRFEGLVDEIKACLKGTGSPKDKYLAMKPSDKKKVITTAVNRCLNSSKTRVSCSCPDFTYRYTYKATKDDYNFGFKEDRFPSKRNPELTGSVCKHLLGVLNAPSMWVSRVVRDIIKCIDWDIDVLE